MIGLHCTAGPNMYAELGGAVLAGLVHGLMFVAGFNSATLEHFNDMCNYYDVSTLPCSHT